MEVPRALIYSTSYPPSRSKKARHCTCAYGSNTTCYQYSGVKSKMAKRSFEEAFDSVSAVLHSSPKNILVFKNTLHFDNRSYLCSLVSCWSHALASCNLKALVEVASEALLWAIALEFLNLLCDLSSTVSLALASRFLRWSLSRFLPSASSWDILLEAGQLESLRTTQHAVCWKRSHVCWQRSTVLIAFLWADTQNRYIYT